MVYERALFGFSFLKNILFSFTVTVLSVLYVPDGKIGHLRDLARSTPRCKKKDHLPRTCSNVVVMDEDQSILFYSM